MTDKHTIIPEIQIVVEHEQEDKASSSRYWQKVSEFYGKVFDGMEYTAYIASGHEPYVVMVKLQSFVKNHQTIFKIIGAIMLFSYLFSYGRSIGHLISW